MNNQLAMNDPQEVEDEMLSESSESVESFEQ
jgi:hypothetical protein